MYVAPIAVHAKDRDIRQVWMMLERNGTHLISLDATDATAVAEGEAFAAVNDIVLAATPRLVGDIVLVPVDMERTDFNLFYTWREVPPGTVPSKEVWRPFVWLSDSLGVNSFLNETVIAGQDHTVFSVLTAHLKEFQ